MSKFEQHLAAGRFVVTTEVAPPKGVELAGRIDRLRNLAGVDAVNVTDNQGGNLRMAPLALAVRLAAAGIEPILQLTCRDRNRLALQADLLGAGALGIENLLILSGDHVRFGDHPEAKAVFDLDSVQLLGVVGRLMQGRDMAGRSLAGAPRFFTGAAVSPEAEPFELMFQKFTKKVEAGARFFQTQAVFEGGRLEAFMAEAKPYGVKVVAGVLLLKSAAAARYLNTHVPGVRVPTRLIERLEKAGDPLREGVAIAREMTAQVRSLCHGVHLMTLGQETRIQEILV